MKPGVYLTIDVECGMGGAWHDPGLDPIPPARGMMGRYGDRELHRLDYWSPGILDRTLEGDFLCFYALSDPWPAVSHRCLWNVVSTFRHWLSTDCLYELLPTHYIA